MELELVRYGNIQRRLLVDALRGLLAKSSDELAATARREWEDVYLHDLPPIHIATKSRAD